jgi:ABC-type polysaccharide/polyol phosphate export permease
MSPHRLRFLVQRDFLIFTRVKWRLAEILYFPVTTILLWGFFTIASKGEQALESALVILVVNVLWNFASMAQTTSNLQIMEDIWSGSLKQVLLTGVTPLEYLAARLVTATIASVFLGTALLGLSMAFGVRLEGAWGPTIAAFVAALVSALGLAGFVAGFILILGREYGFLAWTVIQAFVLLSAPLFPVETFPSCLAAIARVMPFTDAFEIARDAAAGRASGIGPVLRAAAVSAAYLLLSLPFYAACFRRARRAGRLARLA